MMQDREYIKLDIIWTYIKFYNNIKVLIMHP